MSAVRVLHFIRHGQYTPTTSGGLLTGLGRRQAKRTGKRLGRLDIAAVHCSTLDRAIESAHIISDELGGLPIKKTPVLRECLPTAIKGALVPLATRARGRGNVEKVLERYFRSARSERHEVFVCHGNLIRAVVMHALGLPMSKWVKMWIHHGSVTTLTVHKGGIVRLQSFNDFGHMPPSMISHV